MITLRYTINGAKFRRRFGTQVEADAYQDVLLDNGVQARRFGKASLDPMARVAKMMRHLKARLRHATKLADGDRPELSGEARDHWRAVQRELERVIRTFDEAL